MKVFSLIVAILFIAILGNCAYQLYNQAHKGKVWCEKLIREYEHDRGKFIEAHMNNLRGGVLTLMPSPNHKDVKATFIANGYEECKCTYWHGGAIGPHAYEYNSKTKKWENID